MKKYYDMDKDTLLKELAVEATGLSSQAVLERVKEYGKNEFTEQKENGLMSTVLRQLGDISTLILLFAAFLSFALAIKDGHGYVEPIVIFTIVIMNIILAVTQERSAEKALEALSNLNSPSCFVLRDGVKQEIETKEVVPGDVVLLQTGDLVPADARLLESNNLAIDEASLTGESEPSEKDADADLTGNIPLGDQANMVFSGSLVTAGKGSALVVATGMETQIGKIAGFLNDTQKIKTPLQSRLDKIGKIISFIAIISSIILFAVGYLRGGDFWSMVLLAVSLCVAAVPETLSLIVTLSLTQGVKNMIGRNALIRKLPAIETLGSTSVICSDKTGTLTQNKMTVKRLWLNASLAPIADTDSFSPDYLQFLERLALASSATVKENAEGVQIIGDPTETAILRLLSAQGISKAELDKKYPRVMEIPFSSERKMMTTVVQLPTGGFLVLTKGAFDRLPYQIRPENEIHDQFAQDALRVIALASKYVEDWESVQDHLETNLSFEGIIGLIDPPRPEAAAAIERAKGAGIRTVMITGDHAVTASAIAKELGILSGWDAVLTGQELAEMSNEELCRDIERYSVYARVSPEDKIRIVEAWQENGDVVAMTGDGVNDAPALKAADVGVSMGINGTEVAKSASDMILTDDNFAVIVDAVSEGRNVFSNIRKTIYFLLVCNISEIIIMLSAQMLGWGIPVTPVMLLLINVIGDGIPGLFLSRERSDPRIMERKPIGRNESFFSGSLLQVIIQQTIVCSVVTCVGYYMATNIVISPIVQPSHLAGQTMAFIILGWTSILHIFTVRSKKSIFKRTVKDNLPLVFSAVTMIVLFVLLVVIPPVATALELTKLSGRHWLLAIVLSLLPTVVAEYEKAWEYYKQKSEYKSRVVRRRDI